MYVYIGILFLFACDFNTMAQQQEKKTQKKEKFKWNFEDQNIYAYSFEQKIQSINQWGGDFEKNDTSNILGLGDLKIKSKGNDKADFVLTNITFKDLDNNKDKVTSGQNMVVQDMDAHGSFETHKSRDVMIDFLLSLPSYDFKPGDKEKQDLEIPCNVPGAILYIKGYNELEYVKDLDHEDASIAIIKSKIKVDQLDIPKEIKGEFSGSFIGEAEYQFDYENHYFISAQIELDIILKSKYDTGQEAMGELDSYMKNINNYSIQFVGIEKE